LFQLLASDDAVNEDHSVCIEHLVEDSKVTNPKPQELIVRALNRLHELAVWARICAQTVDGSLNALTVGLGRALKGTSCGS
jgi:hypothetical protein